MLVVRRTAAAKTAVSSVVCLTCTRSRGMFARVFPSMPPKSIPEPRNGMDVKTFLTTLGRGLESPKVIDAIGTWEKLFTAERRSLKELGLKPLQRRWLLRWTDNYRKGQDPYYIRKPVKVRLDSKAGRALTLKKENAKVAKIDAKQKVLNERLMKNLEKSLQKGLQDSLDKHKRDEARLRASSKAKAKKPAPAKAAADAKAATDAKAAAAAKPKKTPKDATPKEAK